jgi:hypothetical protein
MVSAVSKLFLDLDLVARSLFLEEILGLNECMRGVLAL